MPNTKSLALLLLPAVAGLSVQTREAAIAAPTLTFKNNCSTQHTLWFAGVRRVTLPPRAAFSGSFRNNEAGYFYTGNANGLNTIKIGFFEDRYWLVKDEPLIGAVAVRVTPNVGAHDGFCVPAWCRLGACTDKQAYPEPPPSKRSEMEVRAEFEPPLYSCPEATSFTITPVALTKNSPRGWFTVQILIDADRNPKTRFEKYVQ
ncbi:hypothetical protein BDV98DRAFT_659682 [Pterulicium gracile]|uniref:Uncharacterized protein n=1 Tax=Pterulicium gracile TaxID=1884261 RepID=A0A5C3Q5P3_9AGAR|nr:hypothetical protein BDV98DRAFT_659682 [Pterula gracilis]